MLFRDLLIQIGADAEIHEQKGQLFASDITVVSFKSQLDAAVKANPKRSIQPAAVILLFDVPNILQAACTVQPATGHGDLEERVRYSSTLSLTLALDGVGCQHHAPAALVPNTEPTSIVQEVGGCRAGLDRCRKYRPLPRLDLRTIQPVMSRYTD